MTEVKQPYLVNLSLDQRRQLLRSIKKDVEFLAENRIMDYSILLSVESKKVC